ncbi:hypothetical protein [Streptomyces hygroscopicus]|uniref:hypothetical protein n=1 Tax=Streptomyces hygroscopicus TaxID=1912 RepID=UPI000AB14C86|nr:hypothetical protein [Streptomyces hygroscopicus]
MLRVQRPEAGVRAIRWPPGPDAGGSGATGAVSIHPEWGEFAFDPDTTNNKAVPAVN